MEKKDSIFSGLNPAPPPAPAAPRPSASEQEISALRQKIESLEKQIKAASAHEAAKAPDSGQFMLAKISDLERKLEEFNRGIMMSSAQMKNIEESKAGARRETEELLKVVREQQKYTEMDRQMHDQVEKSWARVEDLEKKLLDFYASAMNKPPETRIEHPALLGAELDKIVDTKLEKFLVEMDFKFRAMAGKIEETAQEAVRKSAERAADPAVNLSGELDPRLAALGSELKTFVTSSLLEQNEAVIKYINGFVADSEARVSAMSKLMLDYMGGLTEQTRKQGDKLEKLGAAAETDAERSRAAAETNAEKSRAVAETNAEQSRAAMSALAAELKKVFADQAAGIETRLQAENAKNAGEIMAVSRISSFSLTTTTALAANMDELGGNLFRLKDALKVFVDGMKTLKLESLLGVSGMVMRKNFDGVQGVLGEMEENLAAFDKIREEINGHLKI